MIGGGGSYAALRRGLAAAVFTVLAAALPARADDVTIRAAAHDAEGFGRIAFDWPAPVGYQAQLDGETLTIHFDRPLTAKLDPLLKHLDGYVAQVRIGKDGASLIAELKAPASLRSFNEGNTIAVDIVAERPAAASAKPAARPKPPAHAAEPATTREAEERDVPIRVGVHKDWRRIAFDWREPIHYALSQDGDVTRLRFDRPGKLDAAQLAAALPGLAPALDEESGHTIVTLHVPKGIRFRHFRSGRSIVLDVLGTVAKADVAAAATSKPTAIAPPPELVEPAAGPPAADAKQPPAATPAPAAKPSAAASPPAPPGALPVRFALAPDGASLRFDWSKPTAAAVFRRGRALWIVFPGATPLDLAGPRRLGAAFFSRIDQVPDGKATVLRLVPRPGINPDVRRADNAWIIELKTQEARVDAPIAVEARPSASTASVFLAVHEAGDALPLRDPEVGDTLLVVPVGELGRGIGTEQEFVDFRVLTSAQGIAIEPFSDDLRLRRSGDGVEVSRPGGLLLSSDGDRRLAPPPASPGRLFDFARWRGRADESFLMKRSRLERAIAAATPAGRSKPRLALARFYFASLYAAEAVGVIEAIQRDDPALAAEPSVLLMTGAVHLMLGDQKSAVQELGQKSLDNQPEAGLWRAALAAESGDWPAAAHGFALTATLLPRYPAALRDRFALEAAQAYLETGQPEEAQAMTGLVLKSNPPTSDKAMALYFDGRRALAQGDLAQALDLWNKVAGMDDRPSRARALFARTLAQLDAKQISRADAIKALDGLRFAWRGDMFEFKLLRKLGELKLAEGDAANGLDALREAAINFPDYAASKDVMKELSDTFANVFLGKDMEDMPPLKALALYDEFKDYAPVGERGDAVVRRLVDRLVAVDLLDRAAALLEDQVNHRLTGRDKARVAAQLALIRLLDRNPAAALKALDIDVGSDVPPELLRQRQQLRARALTELGRTDEALTLLATDTSRDADRLRADIFWRTHNWAEAAKVFARLVPAPEPDGKLDTEAGRLVLNWASALTLAGDQQGIAALRTAYGKAMAATPFADAFHVVAGDTAPGRGETDPRVIAKRVAQVSELQSFMANYKERVAKDKLSAIN